MRETKIYTTPKPRIFLKSGFVSGRHFAGVAHLFWNPNQKLPIV